jgi:hypothetical protein
MTESGIRGTCDACGKVFRVPSVERTYTCKACGGTVVPEEDAGDAPGVPAQETGAEHPPRRATRRSRSERNTRIAWIVLGGLLVLGLVGFGLYKAGLLSLEAAAEKDIDRLLAVVVEDWEEGHVPALVEQYHPEGRVDFRHLLESAAQARGWQTGFAPVDQRSARVTEGTPEAPVRGITVLLFGEDALTLNWQFDPGRERWYVTSHHITPPALGPRVEGFQRAWAESDPAALSPFFRPGAVDKMAALVMRKAETSGWAAGFPALGEVRISGEESARTAVGALLGSAKVESTFPAGGGELTVRWRFQPEDYAWYVSGFGFPK